MDLRAFFERGIRRAALVFCLTPALMSLSAVAALTRPQSQTTQQQSQDQSQSQQPQAQSGSGASAAGQSDDAAAKAAERKRKFDEQRQLMESGYSPSKAAESRGRVDPDLTLSPMEVNLLVHDRVQFHVYDKGKEAEGGSWSAMPGRILGSWFEKGVFTIEAKSPGTARVGVLIGSRATNVNVTVYPGTKMPKGVERTAETLR